MDFGDISFGQWYMAMEKVASYRLLEGGSGLPSDALRLLKGAQGNTPRFSKRVGRGKFRA
jgi:hypothetical protein